MRLVRKKGLVFFMEIEKKFLVKNLPASLESFEKKEMEQGYLCTSPVVRVRKSNEQYILTYKSHVQDKEKMTKSVCMNQEVEVPLTEEGYYHLREKADGNLIQKTRYMIPLDSSHKAELDIFHGYLNGLVFVEVEFESIEDAEKFAAPDWFGEDVSDDRRYANSSLTTCEEKFWE